MLPTLSRISVRAGPASRFRLGCSSRSLRISPLHREFHSPLPPSRAALSPDHSRLSREILPERCCPTYAPFTPSESGQRLPPTSYRGCWHVVSRGLFLGYRPCSSPRKGVYNPKAFFPHAASLRQAFAHCARFPAAASRKSGGRVSVPLWLVVPSDQLPVFGLVGRYLTNYLIGREPLLRRLLRGFPGPPGGDPGYAVLDRLSAAYPPPEGRLLTRYSAVRHSPGPLRALRRSTCMH